MRAAWRRPYSSPAWLLVLLVGVGCASGTTSPGPDTGASEDASAAPDTGPADSGVTDAEPADTASPDSGAPDAEIPDAGQPDSGIDTLARCGVTGLPQGVACTGVDQCGEGTRNHVAVAFCEHCFSLADTHVCESGTCRPHDASGRLEVRFRVPVAARGARSFTQASLNPLLADGTRATCAALLSTCDDLTDPRINAVRSNFRTFLATGGIADPSVLYTSLLDADIGDERIVLVRVTTRAQGSGDVVAQGCVDAIDVRQGDTLTVTVEMDPT